MKPNKKNKATAKLQGKSDYKFIPWVLFIFAFLLYANSISNDYNLDDELVTRNHRLTSQGLKAIPEIFTSPYYQDDEGYSYDYRPVALTSFAIEHQFFDEKPGISHFINVLIFAFTVVLIFISLTHLLSGYNIIIPLTATLLFAAHPIHTEAVASIKNRDELLCLLFGILSLYSTIKYFKGENKWLYAAALIFFLIALLSKRSIISFSVIIPLAAIIFLPIDFKKLAAIVLPFAFLSALLAPTNILEQKFMFFLGFSILPFIVFGLVQDRILFKEKLKFWIDEIEERKEAVLNKYLTYYVPQKPEWEVLLPDNSRFPILPIVASIIAALLYIGILYEATFLTIIAFVISCLFYLFSKKQNSGPAFLIFAIVTCLVSWVYLILQLPLAIITICCVEILFLRKLKAFYLMVVFIPAFIFNIYQISNFYQELILNFIFLLLLIPSRLRKIHWLGAILISGVFILVFLESFEYTLIKGDYQYFLSFEDELFVGLLSIFLIRWSLSRSPSRFLIRESLVALVLIIGIYHIYISDYKTPEERIFRLEYLQGQGSPLVDDSAPEIETEPVKTPVSFITGGRDLEIIENPLVADTELNDIIGTSSYILGKYLQLMILPYPMHYYYGYKKIDIVDIFSVKSIIPRLIYLLLFIGALVFIKRVPIISFGILAYIFSIAIFSNLLAAVAGVMGDRLTYVASFGFCIASAGFLALLFRVDIHEKVRGIERLKRPFLWAISAILILYSIGTIARNSEWENHLTLFSNDMKNLEESANAHNLLALHLLINADKPENRPQRNEMVLQAISHFNKAIEIYPGYLNFWFDLGRAHIMLNNKKNALAAFKKAVEIDTTFPDAWLYAAYSLEDLGRRNEAEEYYQNAIKAGPENIDAFINFTYMYINSGNFQKALQIAELAVQNHPEKFQPYILLAEIYEKTGDHNRAAYFFEQANLRKR